MARSDVGRSFSHHRLDALSVSTPSPDRRTKEGGGDEVSHTWEVPRIVEPVVQQGVLASMSQPELPADEHLILRPWSVADVPSIVEAYAVPDIQEWNLRTMNAVEAHDWVEAWSASWIAETDACWAIAKRSDGSVVGRIALRQISLSGGSAEVTYWVLPNGRREGAASAATRAVSRWAFESIGLHRLDLHHSVRNESSCGVAVRAGFELEATLQSYLKHADGWHDVHLHALINGSN